MGSKKLIALLTVVALAGWLAACNKSNNNNHRGVEFKGNVMDLKGGDSLTATGGGGGDVILLGIGSEGVKLLKEGDIDDSMDFPKTPEKMDLGDNPLIVEDDMQIPVDS